MSPASVVINGRVCSEAEVATIYEGLILLSNLGYGRISEVGEFLVKEGLIRTDITAKHRHDLGKVRELLKEATRLLGQNSQRGSDNINPNTDAVPSSCVRAMLLVALLESDLEGVSRFSQALRVQAEMCAAKI